MKCYETLWNILELNGTFLEINESLCYFMDHFETLWNVMAIFGTLWHFMERSYSVIAVGGSMAR